jgi:hypothetical protein
MGTGGNLLENIVAEIDAQIARLQQAKMLLMATGAPAKRAPGRPAKTTTKDAPKKAKRRTMSAETREKMRQAQLKRWAATKKNAKPNLNSAVAPLPKVKK